MKSQPKKTAKSATARKIDPAIATALISGVVTILAGILASPVIIAWINKTPIPPALLTATLPYLSETPTEPPTPTSLPTATKIGGPCPFEDMVLIPEGIFWMGASEEDEAAEPDEKPGREIYLSAFCIEKYEVSNRKYAEVAASHVFSAEQANLPVTMVSWFDAKAYCVKLGLDLPTEAQWEKAARGTGEWVYPWGNGWRVERANSFAIEPHKLRPVTDFADGASPYGVYNMAGNVSEWVGDWYDPGWYEIMNKQDPFRSAEPADIESGKVVRGGSYRNPQENLRTSSREWISPPSDSFSFIGFRCVSNSIIP